MATMKEIVGTQLFTLPDVVHVWLYVVLAVLSLVLTEISLVALVVSANSTQRPAAAAKETIALSCTTFIPCTLLTIIFIVANTVIAAPHMLLTLDQPIAAMLLAKNDLKFLLLAYVWQGVTSVVVWTLTVSPICEYLRGRVK